MVDINAKKDLLTPLSEKENHSNKLTKEHRGDLNTLMIGCVQLGKVDAMPPSTLERFKGRLRETVDQVLSYTRHWNDPSFYHDIQLLSDEFGLDMCWEGLEGKWKGIAYDEGYNAYWTNPSLKRHQRLNGGASRLALYNNKDDHMNKWAYVDTLVQLCRYLDIE